MLNWFKKLLGVTPVETKVEQPLVLTEPVVEKTKKPTTEKTKSKKTNKKEIIDLSGLSKTQLLAEAKKRGIKANASLKKEELLQRLSNG